MKVVIVGGGKVGYNLFKTLKERNFIVTLIERDKETCMKIVEDFNAEVFWGDGTNLNILMEAGAQEADIIAAVTGNDEENLVICQMAKISFESKKTIARINNPKNISMFKKLGIDSTVCSTEVIANLIGFEVDNHNYRIISTIEKGCLILVELTIRKNNKWNEKKIKELILPTECVIVSIVRGETVIYPRGDTIILENDKVIILTNKKVIENLAKDLFDGGKKKNA